MKSSTAVFSRQGNPFPVQSQSKTHYHPSQAQPLPSDHKQIVLSPDRAHSLPAHLSDALSPPDIRFLQGSQQLVPGLPESDSSGPFDESWPSTDGSSTKTPEREDPSTFAMKHKQKASAEPSPEDSVIARYIARFRSGLPTSRLERPPPKVDSEEFWWLQTSPDSPDTEKMRPEPGMKVKAGFSPHNLEKTQSSEDGSLTESKLYPEEANVVTLQKRAEKLILQSESSLSSLGAVSSEGLGSSSLSSISCPGYDYSRSRQSVPVQVPGVLTVPPLSSSIQTHVRSRPALAPEEDILYQWRLRRKMEQAREESLSLVTHCQEPNRLSQIPNPVMQTVDLISSFHHEPPRRAAAAAGPCAPSPEGKPGPTLSPITPGYPISSPALAPHAVSPAVPPHLHLTCDILPCIPHQHTSLCTQERARVVSPHNHIPGHPPQAMTPRESLYGQEPPDAPVSQPGDKKDPRKSTQTHKKRAKSKVAGGKRAGTGHEGRARHAEDPPASPVQLVMGEVISERLFSPRVSLSNSEAKNLGPVQPSSPPEPLEIAAQLLEQAEESDGMEFEDDPLLRVLREQRENLRTRLRAVDQMLVEMEPESQDKTSRFE